MLSRRGTVIAVGTAAAGLFLVALDFSINVALPVMRDDLGATLVTVQGIIIFYHASRSGIALTAGSLIDRVGVRRVFAAGVGLYTLAVALIALQDSLAAVVALRVLQGLGAAVLFTSCPAIVSRAIGPSRKGLALGITLGAVSVGQLAATLGGGWLAGAVGWESIFYLRVPVGIAVLAGGWLTMKEAKRGQVSSGAASQGAEGKRSDFLAPGLLYAGLFLTVLAISLVRLTGLLSAGFALAAVGAVLCFWAFRTVERRNGQRLLAPGIWTVPGILASAISNVMVHSGAFVTWFLLPFYVTDVLGYGPVAVGAMLAVTALATTLGSAGGGLLADWLGDRRVTAVGAVVCAVGLVWVSQTGAESGLASLGVRLAVAGAGYGVHQAAVYSLALRQTRADRAGAVSAVLATAQTIGMPLSITIGTAVFAWRERASVSAGTGGTAAFVEGFEWAYICAGVLALLAAAPVIGRMKGRSRYEA